MVESLFFQFCFCKFAIAAALLCEEIAFFFEIIWPMDKTKTVSEEARYARPEVEVVELDLFQVLMDSDIDPGETGEDDNL